MTGEISLGREVLPLGGLKQKILAAHRAGLTSVIFPKLNEADLDDVPEDVRKEMTFYMADTLDDVLEHALQPNNPFDEVLAETVDGSVPVPELN